MIKVTAQPWFGSNFRYEVLVPDVKIGNTGYGNRDEQGDTIPVFVPVEYIDQYKRDVDLAFGDGHWVKPPTIDLLGHERDTHFLDISGWCWTPETK